MSPEITVLMPIAPGARWLHLATASLLAQTHREWSLLAVLDGECERNRAVLEAPDLRGRVRIAVLPARSGVVRALNTGLAAARTELVARLDADDVCEPGRLAIQAGELDRRPGLLLLGSPATVIDEHGRPAGACRVPVGAARVRRRLRWRNAIVSSSVLFRRTAVLEAGGYAEACPYGEDYHLWLRLAASGPLDNVAEPLVRYRRHAGQYNRYLVGPEGAEIRAARRHLSTTPLLGRAGADLRHLAWLSYQHLQHRRRAWATR